MEKIISVIVPVYKVEKYINKCLDSLIISQELMDKTEVLVVNDGTPDNSAVLAYEYAELYPNTFKIIDKDNGGHGSAWNLGVEMSKGKYIRFLDSDDWLTEYEELVKQLMKYDVDILFTKTRIVNVRDNTNLVYDFGSLEYCKKIDAESFDWLKTNSIFKGHNITNFHQATYKSSILKPFLPLFLERQHYDDEILFVLPIIMAKSFVILNITLYNYLVGREGQSIDPNVYLKSIGDKIKSRKYNQLFVNNHPCESKTKNAKLQYILNKRNENIYRAISKLSYCDSKKAMNDFVAFIKKEQPDFAHSKMYDIYNCSFFLYWTLYHIVQPRWQKIKHMIDSF